MNKCLQISSDVEAMIPQFQLHPGFNLSSACSHRLSHIMFSIYFCEKCQRIGRGWWEPRISVATWIYEGLVLSPHCAPHLPRSATGSAIPGPKVLQISYLSESQGFKKEHKRGQHLGKTLSERCRRVSLSILFPLLTSTSPTSPS